MGATRGGKGKPGTATAAWNEYSAMVDCPTIARSSHLHVKELFIPYHVFDFDPFRGNLVGAIRR